MDKIICINSSDTEVLSEKKKELLSTIKETFEVSSLDLSDVDCGSVLSELETIPFLTEKKVVVLKNALLFSKQDDGKYADTFLAYLKNPNQSTILIIEITEKPDAKDKVFKAIKKNSLYFSLDMLDDKNLISFTRKSFENDGYKIEQSLVSEVVRRCSNDLALLKSSIEKIKLFKLDSKVVKLEDINLLITKSVEDNVFDIVNAVLEHNVKKAYYLYQDLISNNYDVTQLVSLILNKFNEILLVKRLVDSRYSKEEIMQTFKVSSGRAYYMMKDASKITEETLKKQINSLCLLEYQIKSGQIDKNIGFEIYLTKI